jgi:thioredoxin 2
VGERGARVAEVVEGVQQADQVETVSRVASRVKFLEPDSASQAGLAGPLPGHLGRQGDNGAMTDGVVLCGHCGAANRVPAAAAGTPRCGKCHQPLPWIADADDATFAEVAEAARIPVIVDLWAPWCGPCRTVSPALEQLARDLAGKVKLVKVNVDTSPQISQRFRVQAIPTLLMLRHGQVAARQTGAIPPATLRTWADKALATG